MLGYTASPEGLSKTKSLINILPLMKVSKRLLLMIIDGVGSPIQKTVPNLYNKSTEAEFRILIFDFY